MYADDLVAQVDHAGDLGAAEVEVAVLEPQLFVDFDGFVDVERRRQRLVRGRRMRRG